MVAVSVQTTSSSHATPSSTLKIAENAGPSPGLDAWSEYSPGEPMLSVGELGDAVARELARLPAERPEAGARGERHGHQDVARGAGPVGGDHRDGGPAGS